MRSQTIYSKSVNIIIAATLQTMSISKSMDIVELYKNNFLLSYERAPITR